MGCSASEKKKPVTLLVAALHYKSEGRGFDSRLEFFIDTIIQAAPGNTFWG
jgi:hypothetical protein